MPTKIADTISQARAGAARALEGLKAMGEIEQSIRSEHVAAVRERDRIRSLPEPVDIIVENMRAVLADNAIHRMGADRLHGIRNAFSRFLEARLDGPDTEHRPALWEFGVGPLTFGDLAAILPDFVGDRLEGLIRSTPYEAGLPFSERPAALAAIDARIRALEDQHADLVDSAAELDPPLGLDHLPAVLERREQERRARVRVARLTAEQRSTIAKAREAGHWVECNSRGEPVNTRTVAELLVWLNLTEQHLRILDEEGATAVTA